MNKQQRQRQSNLSTDVVDDTRYEIEFAVPNEFTVRKVWFPIFPAGNVVVDEYEVRTTPKRAVANGRQYRDNWNGTGSHHFGKAYLEKAIVQNWMAEIDGLMEIEDDDDRQYEAAQLVKKIISAISSAQNEEEIP